MNKDKFIAEKLGFCWHEREPNEYEHGMVRGGYKFNCSCDTSYIQRSSFESHLKRKNPDFTNEAGRVKLLKLMDKNGRLDELVNDTYRNRPKLPSGWVPSIWMSDNNGLFRDLAYKMFGGSE